MSKCYNLVCPETKKAIWVGQSKHIYGTDQFRERLAAWLHEHEGKAIYFVDDEDVRLVDVPEENFTGLGKDDE